MTWRCVLGLVLGLVLGSVLISQTPQRTLWNLVWSDEFDGSDGSAPDPTKWAFDLGGGGWGNDERQSYTNRPQNVELRQGKLIISARKESFTGSDGIQREYTSARLKTKGLFSQAYGRFEARIQIPFGQGIWPAFWMLGSDIDTVGWPTCGEIDIMENIGKEPSIVHGTIHGPGHSGDKAIGSPRTLRSGKYADDYHLYAVEWEPDRIRFYVDSELYALRTPADLL